MDGSTSTVLHADSGTWHHGLIARWWAEFNVAEPDELAYFRKEISTFGEPALDLGCGTGRILLPLLRNRSHALHDAADSPMPGAAGR